MIKENVKERLSGKLKDWFIKNPKRIYFTIDNKDLIDVVNCLYKDFAMRFSTATAIDNENNFEIIYHFSYDKTGEIFNVRVYIEDRNNPTISSLTKIFRAAEWIEREIHELFGINFIGHPNLKHLLLSEDWPTGVYPLRKEYKGKGEVNG